MKAKYIKPSMHISDVQPVSFLAGSIVIDNNGEHDGWADAKPRIEEEEEELFEETAVYGDLWR